VQQFDKVINGLQARNVLGGYQVDHDRRIRIPVHWPDTRH